MNKSGKGRLSPSSQHNFAIPFFFFGGGDWIFKCLTGNTKFRMWGKKGETVHEKDGKWSWTKWMNAKGQNLSEQGGVRLGLAVGEEKLGAWDWEGGAKKLGKEVEEEEEEEHLRGKWKKGRETLSDEKKHEIYY